MKFGNLIVCFSLLIAAGCSSTGSNSVFSSNFNPRAYDTVLVYEARTLSFLEIELQQFFEGIGFKVIGELELANHPSNVLGVRYEIKESKIFKGEATEFDVIITLDDLSTGRAVGTINVQAHSAPVLGGGEAAKNELWRLIKIELEKATEN